MPSASSIAAILPAYNEASRIGTVLEALCQVECLNDIIIIDDGSTDATLAEIQRVTGADARVKVISHPTNQGKGQAIFSGLRVTQANFIVMVDADLIGLAPHHIEALIEPVWEGKADMTLGLFQGGRWNTDLSHRWAPWLSGQRCLKVELFQEISHKAASGFGLETAFTVAAKKYKWRLQPVPLQGMTHASSRSRRVPWDLVWRRILLYLQVVRAWVIASRQQ